VSGETYSQEGTQWFFYGEAGDIVSARMVSDHFDTYLEIYSPTGLLVCSNDDGSVNSMNAQIISCSLPRTGLYTLVSKGYNGATGSYYLSLDGSSAPSEPELELGPEDVVRSFYLALDAGVTSGDFHPAFRLLSARRQGRQSYADFAAGYDTTRAISIDSIALISQSKQQARVNAVVYAIDEIDGEVVDATFDITWTLRMENDQWRLDRASVTK
jgi:hypothetical protein